ncbi:stage V sporulation protein D [Petroclostridium sp. X23]|uniref:stage V sporulation protein D n=1 Tax=Petroclostridium sp. X23 TaxID=3045146 RepID=UPI0024AE8731|nr:stage V sporulation protein D [Petroclostridium sp. X23]WHH58887.1 stage V sporulation protein D [Petroclostridium sp. X23]
MAAPKLAIKKRILFLLVIFTFTSIGLMARTGWWQIKEGERLQKEAIEQQTRDRIINSKRGTIFDRNGKPLAISASVETVTAIPNEIKKAGNAEEIASTLSEILEMNYDDVYKRITRNSAYEIIKRKIEKKEADQIREADFKGIHLDEDSKRYYPYGNFASHILGATGTDNQGLFGLEAKYDKYLKGLPGRIVSAKDAIGTEMPYKYERYVNPEDGANLVLTIDEVIQHFAEKHLETALIDNKLANGAAAIIMDPRTGDILAMAVKPDFDLNNPFQIADETAQKELEQLSGDAFTEKYKAELGKMWRNKAVVDSYEPGSTFKIITSAAGLEENAVKPTDQFTDIGYLTVAGRRIKCWRSDRPHGLQTFVQGVQNSCNPVFMEVAARMGSETFYKYVKAFGFLEKTGIDFDGETSGIFHKLSAFNELELATASFGQGFQITPLQMVSAISAVANDGLLLKPRLVKQITDIDGNVMKTFEPEVVRQVISKETSATLRGILESVVSEGTGKNAYIKGYRVAGKTGTSEKLPRGTSNYVASFVGFAPADDPKVVCLVILDEPKGDSYFGGVIAAPVVGKILDDTLNYLEVEPKFTEEELMTMDVFVPEVRNMDIKEAQNTLKDINLKYKIEGTGNTIIDQTPKPGAKLQEKSLVILYTEGSEPSTSITIPDVVNKSVLEANQILVDSGLNIKINGSGTAIKQEPAAGTVVSPGTVVNVDFRFTDVD